MALAICNLQPLLVFPLRQRRIPSKLRFIRAHVNQEKSQLQLFSSYKTYHCIFRVKSASVNGYPISSDDSKSSQEYAQVALSDKLKNWIKLVREIFPGGEWWRLSSEEIDVGLSSKPVTVLRALQKMWELIAQDRWVVYTAFATLIVAALSEISIPHYLTASIFSAESSKTALFHQNVRLLVMLCIMAGVCRLTSKLQCSPYCSMRYWVAGLKSVVYNITHLVVYTADLVQYFKLTVVYVVACLALRI